MSYNQIPKISESRKKDFLGRISKQQNGCWMWSGGIHHGGYGVFWAGNKALHAHRVSFFLHNDIDPGQMCVCHTCDVRSCVNPSHLFIGTHKDNVADRNRKGRHAFGIRNGKRKLNPDMVQSLRLDYSTGMYSQRSLAAKYGLLSHGQIGQIIRGTAWVRDISTISKATP